MDTREPKLIFDLGHADRVAVVEAGLTAAEAGRAKAESAAVSCAAELIRCMRGCLRGKTP